MFFSLHLQKTLNLKNPVMIRLLVCRETAKEPRLTAQAGASRGNVSSYRVGEKHKVFVTMHQASTLGEKGTEGPRGRKAIWKITDLEVEVDVPKA